MAWRQPDDKPLSEPRMESLLTHIWFKITALLDSIMMRSHEHPVMWSQITSHSTVCLTAQADPHPSLHYWPFVRRIHRWPATTDKEKSPTWWCHHAMLHYVGCVITVPTICTINPVIWIIVVVCEILHVLPEPTLIKFYVAMWYH